MADELADQLIDNSGVQGDVAPPERTEPIHEVEPKRSLRDEIKHNFKEAQTKLDKSLSPAGDLTRKPETPPSERPRAPDGTFIPKAAAQEAAPVPTETKQDVQPKQAIPAGPPPGWSKESKAVFTTLPPSVQADVLKRETEVSSGFKQYSDKTKRYDEIDAILAPRRAQLQQLGVTSDAQAINALLQWEEKFRTSPYQAIAEIARSRNLDLSQLVQSPTGQASDATPDAAFRPFIEQAVQPLAQQLQSLQAERERDKADRVQADIATFSKDKPHFEAVRALMGRMIQSGAAPDLDTAYQMAIYADPTVRAAVLQEEQAKSPAAQTQRSSNARLAAVSVTSRAPTGAVTNGAGKKQTGKGVRGSILAAIDEVRERERA